MERRMGLVASALQVSGAQIARCPHAVGQFTKAHRVLLRSQQMVLDMGILHRVHAPMAGPVSPAMVRP